MRGIRSSTDENAFDVLSDYFFWNEANDGLQKDKSVDVICSRSNQLLENTKQWVELKIH